MGESHRLTECWVVCTDDNAKFATEPSPGNFTFHDGDVIANLAHRNGALLRGTFISSVRHLNEADITLVAGHNCVWHNQLPDWVNDGTFTKAELISIVERPRIPPIVPHWHT